MLIMVGLLEPRLYCRDHEDGYDKLFGQLVDIVPEFKRQARE